MFYFNKIIQIGDYNQLKIVNIYKIDLMNLAS